MIIWLASYPRSGNTFLRVILRSAFDLNTYSIYNDPNDIAADPGTSQIVGHEALGEDFDVESARSSSNLYVIKTHAPPENDTDRAIYIVRDGRESSVSYAHYAVRYGTGTSVKDELERIVCGLDEFGTWGQHVSSWHPETRRGTLLLKFEELTAAPANHLQRLSDFIERPIRGNQIPSFSELHATNDRFFRRGANDSWREELDSNLHTLFWLKNYAEMTRHSYTTDVPAALCSQGAMSIIGAASLERYRVLKTATIETRALAESLSSAAKTAGEQGSSAMQSVGKALSRHQARADRLASRYSLLLERDGRPHEDVPIQDLLPSESETLNLVSELLDELLAKDETIFRVRQEIAVANQQVESLNARIASLGAQEQSLRDDLTDTKTRLERVSLERQRQVAALEREIEGLGARIERLQAVKKLGEEFVNTSVYRSPARKYRAYRAFEDGLADFVKTDECYAQATSEDSKSSDS
jgi:hypothetical protein